MTAFLNVLTPTFSSSIQIHGGTTNSGTAYLYLTGSSAVLSGNNAIDASGQAKNLWFFGLPQLTSLSLSSASTTNFTGVIYAPSANVTINVGFLTSMIGSLMAHSLTLNGHFMFHFDEDLLNSSTLH